MTAKAKSQATVGVYDQQGKRHAIGGVSFDWFRAAWVQALEGTGAPVLDCVRWDSAADPTPWPITINLLTISWITKLVVAS